MKIRIAFGAVLGLAAAFAFVFLQFRAEAIAQQPTPEDPQPLSADPLESKSFASDGDEAPSALNAPFEDSLEPADDYSEPFRDDPEPVAENQNLFSPDDDSLPESNDAFGSNSDSEFDLEESFDSPPSRQYPLQIVRLRNVEAQVAYSIVWSLFEGEARKHRWFISPEKQSNSLLFKGPAEKFEQIKRLIGGLDRLAELPENSQKKTYSWPVPHVVTESSDDNSESSRDEWPIRIIRLRFVSCREFARIAWDLVTNQNPDTKLLIEFEPTTNTIIMRGPVEEIKNVEQLAQQLDQPPTGPAAGDLQLAPPAISPDSALDPFATAPATAWETLKAPADRAKELREQVAKLDARSVDLAREIRTLQKRYSGQNPKLVAARNELKSLLEESFQARLQIQSIEVSILKNRLQDIESRVHQRAQLRQQIIDRRLHELLGEKDDLSWEVAVTRPELPNDSLDKLPSLPTPEAHSPLDETSLLPEKTEADELVPRTPYVGDLATIEPGTLVEPGATYDPDNVLESDILPDPIAAEPLDIVESVVPVSDARNFAPPVGSTLPMLSQGGAGQQELIVAENAVEIAALKVERIQNRLKRVKDAEQAEDLNYELRMATLSLDQARKLLDQKLRWIEAQRNSLKVNIQLLEKNLEVLKNEYELFTEANKNVPGIVPIIQIEQQVLGIEEAELRLKQATADLEVFDVENRSSRKPRTTSAPPQSQPTEKTRLVPEPDSGLEIIESDDGENPTGSILAEPANDALGEPRIEFDSSDSLPDPDGTSLEPSSP